MEIIINQLQKNELFKGLSAEKIENVINKIYYFHLKT